MRRSAFLFVCLILIFIIFNIGIIGAQEWSPPLKISDMTSGFYPQIIAIGDTLHVLYEARRHYYDNICYVRSTDAGITWSYPYNLAPELCDSCEAIFPRIIKYGSRIICLWENMTAQGWMNVCYKLSTDSGESWGRRYDVLDTNWLYCWCFTASGADSIINVIFHYPDTSGIFLYDVRSTDFGQSWSLPQRFFRAYVLTAGSDQVSFNNYVHYIWSGFLDTGYSHLYYIKSTDMGVSWEENIQLDSVWYGGEPNIAVNEHGILGVAWDFAGANIRLSYDSGDSWENQIKVATGTIAGYVDMAISSSTIAVVWNAIGPRDLFFNKSYNFGQDWDDEYWLDRDSDESRDPAVAISKGRFFAVWYNDDCYDSTCGLYFSYWPYYGPDVIGNNNITHPANISLSSYPNPFNSSTTISFANLQDAEIKIFDIKGALIKTFRSENKSVGSIIWNGTDDNNHNITSGIYFARASGKNGSASIKLIYLK